MGDYTAAPIGVYAKTLDADAVDVVRFDTGIDEIEIFSDGAAAIYVTVDGSAPSVEGGDCYELPAMTCTRVIAIGSNDAATVKLISAGTPMYSICQLAAGGAHLDVMGGDIDGGTP